MPRVFVTGADGFIGSHLVERLLQRGYPVTAFVWYNALGHYGWLDRIQRAEKNDLKIVSGDIRDPHALAALMNGCSSVMHLASLIGIPYSYHAPASYVQTNIQGTLNVLEAARSVGVNRFVHVSTSEVYGTAKSVPMDETHPLSAQSPYAATKIAADHLVLSYVRSFDFPALIVRPFNTFGPRQSTRAIIPTIITQLCRQSPELKLGSLTPTRDFTYVTDTADGLIAALRAEDCIDEVIHLGSGSEISVGDLANRIVKLMNASTKIVCEQTRVRPKDSEVDRLLASIDKAKKLLGWAPKVDFDDGLMKTIEWFRTPQTLELYRHGDYGI